MTKKRTYSLCPKPPQPLEENNQKVCPVCGAIVNNLVKYCPQCGQEFGCGSGKEAEDLYLVELGELFDEQTLEQIKYIRSQRKMRFPLGWPPDGLWDLWAKRYPSTILCNEWLYQAVFRGAGKRASMQQFLEYLHRVSPNPDPDWLNFHMKVEFGDPNHSYHGKKGLYSTPPVNLTRLNWWSVLRVEPLSTAEIVKFAYQNLVRQAEDDTDAVALLNWAIEQFNKSSRSNPTVAQGSQSVVHWDDLIRAIDEEMKRLNWSKHDGKIYLQRTYGKKSRIQLTDEEIWEFFDYLKAKETAL